MAANPSSGPGGGGGGKGSGGHNGGQRGDHGSTPVLHNVVIVSVVVTSHVTDTIPVVHIVNQFEPPDPCETCSSTVSPTTYNAGFYGLVASAVGMPGLAGYLSFGSLNGFRRDYSRTNQREDSAESDGLSPLASDTGQAIAKESGGTDTNEYVRVRFAFEGITYTTPNSGASSDNWGAPGGQSGGGGNNPNQNTGGESGGGGGGNSNPPNHTSPRKEFSSKK